VRSFARPSGATEAPTARVAVHSTARSSVAWLRGRFSAGGPSRRGRWC